MMGDGAARCVAGMTGDIGARVACGFPPLDVPGGSVRVILGHAPHMWRGQGC